MPLVDNLRKAASLVLGAQQPTQAQASLAALPLEGMTASTKLGPGAPIYPADGISDPPRGFDYPTGYNIAARPRSQERMSFEALYGLMSVYDIAQIAVSHRIAALRALDWTIVPQDGVTDDVTADINRGRAFFRKPDGKTIFSAWLAKYLHDVFWFDAGTLYRDRNNADQVIGLKVVDGKTIAPLIDAWGDRPTGNAPAYVQFVSGTTWEWLLETDLIYQAYEPLPDSPYGSPPIEKVVIGANTDLRLQQYFLQKFTAGNIPAGFGIAPELWSPDQITQWQNAWDAQFLGNTQVKSQIRWVPGGTKFEFPDLQNFDDGNAAAADWYMRKTASAFLVNPDELGFTQDSNRSVGESQADVQQRVGDVPMAKWLATIFTDVLQDDLGLRVEFQFDLGNEEEDRLQTAQADEVYMHNGVVSPSKIAELRFGIVDPEDEIVPRYIFSNGAGPVPLSTLFAAAGKIDPESGSPAPGSVVPAAQTEQLAVGGTVTDAATETAPPAPQSDTLGSLPGLSADAAQGVTKAAENPELRAFAKFRKSRQRLGTWRDFTFTSIDEHAAHRLNVAGYGAIRKASGELVAAGLAVQAGDTGRLLMLQRSLDPTDSASGTWEFPGGCIEVGEAPYEAAVREWQEETGLALPDGFVSGDWLSPNGVYGGFVYVVETEFDIAVRMPGMNPDDPDGDFYEALAWWEPNLLINNPAVRAELAVDLSIVFGALAGNVVKGEYLVGVVEQNGIGALMNEPDPLGQVMPDGSVMSVYDDATEGVPIPEPVEPMPPFLKAGFRGMAPKTPQHEYDLQLTDHYMAPLEDLLRSYVNHVDVGALVEQFPAPVQKAAADFDVVIDGHAVSEAVVRAFEKAGYDLDEMQDLLEQMYEDGWTAGEHAAAAQLSPHVVSVQGLSTPTVDTDWAHWTPGNPAAAVQIGNGGLQELLQQSNVVIKGVSDSLLKQIGNTLADGLSRGDSIASLTKLLKDLDLRSRAERIAHTESTRAVMAATQSVYTSNGVGKYDVLTSDGAEEYCVEIAEAGPYDTNDQTGQPPLHPYCRCSTVPVVDSIVGDDITTTDALGVDSEEE